MNYRLKDQLWQLWNICTLFEKPYESCSVSGNEGSETVFDCDSFILSETTESKGNGVFLRKDTLKNISAESLCFSNLRSRFVFDGGEYEVYTQYNGWQNESQGQWLPLVTEISAGSESVRSASGAAPFLALWNLQTGRGVAFHLLADASWSITAKRFFAPGENSYVGVELGIDAGNVSLTVPVGEKLKLPEVLYYEFQNKTDMDCWRLHRYCHDSMPRRRLPVVYNTWLYKFDHIDFESVSRQIPVAAKLGVEYFVIDAGWFGQDANWGANIGDWEENLNFGFRGRMKEIADCVRRHGMKFGLWLEPERAVGSAVAVQKHPEYFLQNGPQYFMNFAIPEARDYIFNVLCNIIDRYGIEFVKFDFNADLCFDNRASAFTEYFQGYRKFLKRLQEKYPELYLSNCASGGMRMILTNCRDFESFWLSDNQSPYHGMRIFKDSMLRLPPQVIERWAVITTNNKITARAGYAEHIFSTNDATWDRVSDVSESWLKGFLSCSPICFSCDLEALSDSVKEMLTAHIRDFKEEQEFWMTAECRILADTPSVLVLQYNDRAFKKCVIHVFTYKIKQTGLSVFPVLDVQKTYHLSDGTNRIGKEIAEDGIRIKPGGNYRMVEFTILAE